MEGSYHQRLEAGTRVDQVKEQRSPADIQPARRRMCLLVGTATTTAIISDVSARGAFLETSQRPPLGAGIELRHPVAGAISAQVSAISRDGIGVTFPLSPRAVAFALATLAAGFGSAA